MESSANRPDDKALQAARQAIAQVREALDAHFSVRLWDGSLEPLGENVKPGLALVLASPGLLPSLLRWPSLDRIIRHYAHGRIDIEGGTLLDLAGPFALDKARRRRLRQIDKWRMAKTLLPLLTARADSPDASRAFDGGADGESRKSGDNRRFINFHYDVGNDFYQLFLDPEMQYSCAHYPTWDSTLEAAQISKMDLICRKLRLKPGESFLDIGCGWGGLICHAVKNYGVRAHGVTLSTEQLAFAQAKAERLGVADRVSLELRDYKELTGTFDKIASVGMYEHIGLGDIPAYFSKMRRLLAEDGLFLNHAISRKSKKRKRRLIKRPEQRALQRYIFPGGELDDIGHTVEAMERTGFEIHDVEGLRPHYARTTRIWCERLTARREEAEALVGPETYRIWVAYLAGCSLSFERGSARLYQTLAGKSAKGAPPVPATRADIYADAAWAAESVRSLKE